MKKISIVLFTVFLTMGTFSCTPDRILETTKQACCDGGENIPPPPPPPPPSGGD